MGPDQPEETIRVRRRTGRPSEAAARANGFTLIEIIVVTTISILLIGGFVIALSGSHALFDQQVQQRLLDQIGRSAMNRLSEEIHAIDPSTVLPTLLRDSPYVEFESIRGYSGDQPVRSPLIRIAWEPTPGESLNGVDDNGDGRIDEGTLSYHEAGKRLYDIVGHVTGARFSSAGDGIAVELDVSLVDSLGEVVTRTFYRTIAFRN